jgi:hypothetical protein
MSQGDGLCCQFSPDIMIMTLPPTVADRFTGAIVDYFEKLETFPQRGTRRDDLRPGPRTIGFRRRVTIVCGLFLSSAFSLTAMR